MLAAKSCAWRVIFQQSRQRVPWHENGNYVLTAVGVSLAVLLAVVIAAVTRLFRRLFLRNRPRPSPQPGTRWLPLPSQLAAWVWSALLLSVAIFMAVRGDNSMPPTYAWDKYFVLANFVAAVAILLSAVAMVSAIRIWRADDLRSITKAKYSLVALACAMLSWFAAHWHLISSIRI